MALFGMGTVSCHWHIVTSCTHCTGQTDSCLGLGVSFDCGHFLPLTSSLKTNASCFDGYGISHVSLSIYMSCTDTFACDLVFEDLTLENWCLPAALTNLVFVSNRHKTAVCMQDTVAQ